MKSRLFDIEVVCTHTRECERLHTSLGIASVCRFPGTQKIPVKDAQLGRQAGPVKERLSGIYYDLD